MSNKNHKYLNDIEHWILPFIKNMPKDAITEKHKPIPNTITLSKPAVGKVTKMLKLSKIYLPVQEQFRVKILKKTSPLKQRHITNPITDLNDDSEPKPATARGEENLKYENMNNNENDDTENVKESYEEELTMNDNQNDLDDIQHISNVDPIDDKSIPENNFQELCKNMQKLNAQIDKLLKKPEDAVFTEKTAIEMESEILSMQDTIEPNAKMQTDVRKKTNIKKLLKRNRKVFSIAFFFYTTAKIEKEI